MAANRIKGITIEIGGDTTKLQTALKGVNTEVRNTQQQLKDVEKLLKLDPGNTELLAQKHKLLGEAVTATKEKFETLKTNVYMSRSLNEFLSMKRSRLLSRKRQSIPISALTSWRCF